MSQLVVMKNCSGDRWTGTESKLRCFKSELSGQFVFAG